MHNYTQKTFGLGSRSNGSLHLNYEYVLILSFYILDPSAENGRGYCSFVQPTNFNWYILGVMVSVSL